MKTKIYLFVFLFFMSGSCLHLIAQKENKNSNFGLGATLFNYTEFALEYGPSSVIYLTFDKWEKFRLEPTIAFTLNDGLNPFAIGIGAFRKKSLSDYNLLYGIRLGINSEAFSIAPALAGEYYFHEKFSAGAEVQLKGFIIGGEPIIVTNSSVLVRFYF